MPIPHNAYSTDWSTFLENINSIWICNFFPEEYVNICMMIMFISCFVVYINSAQNYFFYANWKFMFMYVNICSNVKFHNIFRWDTPLFNAIIFITSLSNHFLSHKFFTFCVIFIDILKTLSKYPRKWALKQIHLHRHQVWIAEIEYYQKLSSYTQ